MKDTQAPRKASSPPKRTPKLKNMKFLLFYFRIRECGYGSSPPIVMQIHSIRIDITGCRRTHPDLIGSWKISSSRKAKMTHRKIKYIKESVSNSVVGPWHFVTDEDPNPRIRTTELRIRLLLFFVCGLQDANKNANSGSESGFSEYRSKYQLHLTYSPIKYTDSQIHRFTKWLRTKKNLENILFY